MDYFAFVQYLSYILTNRSTLSYKGHYNPYFLAKKQTKGTEKFKTNIQLASKKADSVIMLMSGQTFWELKTVQFF